MNEEMRDKIAKLPVWAREYIKRLESLPDELTKEAAMLRQKVGRLEERDRRLSAQIEAMTELFRCAAIGGSEGARNVVSVLEGYEFFPRTDENSSS